MFLIVEETGARDFIGRSGMYECNPLNAIHISFHLLNDALTITIKN